MTLFELKREQIFNRAVVGGKSIGVERNSVSDGTCVSGADEMILYLDNGKEIFIYQDDEGQMHIESD